MKKIFALFFAAALLAALPLGGCAKTAIDPAASATDEPLAATAAPADTETPGVSATIAPVDYRALGEAIQPMLPLLDAIVGTMGVGGGNAFMPSDPVFLWSVLYLAGMDRAFMDGTVSADSSEAVVPGSVMQEIAGAALSHTGALPPVPDELGQSVAYDAANDAYRLALSDSGDTETLLETYRMEPDGTLSVTLGLYVGAGERYGAIRFTLTENPAASGAYPFAVLAASEDATPFASWQEVAVNTPFAADLDGDGAEETILVNAGTEGEGATVTVTDDGVGYTCEYEYELMMPTVFLADIQAGDGLMEIVLTGDMASDDYTTLFHRYADGVILRQEIFGEATGASGAGLVDMRINLNVLGTYGAACRYSMTPDFAFTLNSAYTVIRAEDGSGADESDAWHTLTLKRDGFPVTNGDGQAVTLAKGEKLQVTASDDASFVDLAGSDGSFYRAEISRKDDDWQWFIAGVPESDWFEMLPYAG